MPESPLLQEVRATRDKVLAAIETLQVVLGVLNEKVAQLLERESHSQEVDAKMDHHAYLNSDMIRLNVRGSLFSVPRDILLKYPGSYFDVMLSLGRARPNSEGEYFIDRNPLCFANILRCMEQGWLCLEGLDDEEVLAMEGHLEYFRLPLKFKLSENHGSSRIQAHESSVLSLLQLRDHRICSGASNGVIKIWSKRLDLCEMELRGHKGGVNEVIQLVDDNLCSCARDRTVKLWNLILGVCFRTLEGHSTVVKSVIQLQDRRICSASNDKQIIVWNSEGELQGVLEGHKGAVQHLIEAHVGAVVSSSADRTLRVWSLRDFSCTRSMSLSERAVHIQRLSSNRIITLLFDTSLVIANIATGELNSVLPCHSGWVHCALLLRNGIFCSAGFSRVINLWDLTKNAKIMSLCGHEAEIRSMLELEDGRLLSGAEDGSIRLWS